ncbi:ATP-dependent Clp protease ATP-binding subunit ClpX, partial [Escherichia coli]|nr:ATP-dependent Clp protease ATP-binding subunit ClpX [Escherichia coli]EJO9114905.1 ATP-dependent Clp protease ATP-binding subunit ClpX [Escherichia coli]
ESLNKIETQDLIKFGLVPEFVGRLPVIAILKDLDKVALKNILSKPKNALVKQYQELYSDHSLELVFNDEALEAVAEEAIMKKTGARGLRSIVERVLSDSMFILPEMEKGTVIEINADVVKGKIPAIQIHVDKKTA